ncbi:lysophospholipid acyltransferase family protein [Fructilactobacillus fructivorans]|uniref:lysophospholipid acyltransferase family protein n=1 Tax=Fructilactobacillus fructivorans TaxID=1614 RepID=UPI000704DA0C|nr:1-acyl-sn-glycerol-3-phosphate acyltransferase [Fructilactobacillus fructivorans]
MWYSFLFTVGQFLLRIVNGPMNVMHKNRLPKGNYVLIAPHRSWFDMILIATVIRPKQLCFMAKKELFKNPMLGWFLRHVNVFSVDRANPDISAIKIPVKALRKTNLSLMMFPSGTRHSKKLKGGAALIAQLAGVPLVPVVYQGPLTLKEVFKRQKVSINFGDPIYISKAEKLDNKNQKLVEKQMQTAFDQLDNEVNPNYVYVDESKPHNKKTSK